MFDVSETAGEPLPELEPAAMGAGDGLGDGLLGGAGELGVRVEVVPQHDWSHGDAGGVCRYSDEGRPEIEVHGRENEADLASTLVHEYAHALLHEGNMDAVERAAREVEAESVAYVVGRACGLEMSGSAFYLAAWAEDDVSVVRERVDRISRTAGRICGALDG